MQPEFKDTSWLTNDNDNDTGRWERKFILFPRLGMKVGRFGIKRKLIMPGTYETRLSRSVGRRIYREMEG